MKEIILQVLKDWKDLQPNMASASCRELLARDLHDALSKHLNIVISKR